MNSIWHALTLGSVVHIDMASLIPWYLLSMRALISLPPNRLCELSVILCLNVLMMMFKCFALMQLAANLSFIQFPTATLSRKASGDLCTRVSSRILLNRLRSSTPNHDRLVEQPSYLYVI
jgi:hypothetical protein